MQLASHVCMRCAPCSRRWAVFAVFFFALLLIGGPIVSVPAGHRSVVDLFGYVPEGMIEHLAMHVCMHHLKIRMDGI